MIQLLPKQALVACLLAALFVLTGCNTDMVVSPELNEIEDKRIYVSTFTSEDPGIGQVIRDIMIKEMLRAGVPMTPEDQANLIITGAAFLTDQSKGRSGIFTSSSRTTQSIESVSVVVKTPDGRVMASGSYDNSARESASEIAKELGAKVASKLD